MTRSVAALTWAAQARARGLKIALDPLNLAPDALWRAAQARGIPRAAYHADPQTLFVRDAAGVRSLAADDWQEVAAWLNR